MIGVTVFLHLFIDINVHMLKDGEVPGCPCAHPVLNLPGACTVCAKRVFCREGRSYHFSSLLNHLGKEPEGFFLCTQKETFSLTFFKKKF